MARGSAQLAAAGAAAGDDEGAGEGDAEGAGDVTAPGAAEDEAAADAEGFGEALGAALADGLAVAATGSTPAPHGQKAERTDPCQQQAARLGHAADLQVVGREIGRRIHAELAHVRGLQTER